MKILQVVDKQGSAIDILANFIQRHNRQHQIDILPLHPKRPDEDTVAFLRKYWNTYDLIHWQYWKSWKKAQEIVPEVDQKTSILTHHNPYDVDKEEWLAHHREVVFMNEAQRKIYGRGRVIRHAVDERLWRWQPNDHETIGMCANRIEAKKGVLEIAQVARELGVPFIVMGRISDPAYWQQVLNTGADIQFHEGVPFELMPEVYQKMGVYVVNSVDGFESGPMPPIEAMLCGIPVISRPVGAIVEVFKDNEHVLLFDTPAEMKRRITQAFKQRADLREKAWKEAKNLNSVRFARQYNKLYHQVICPGQPLVSVIMPYSEDRIETYPETLETIEQQTYKNIEVLMKVDSEPGYNLARVRNELITEAHGEYVLLLDDRWKLEEHAIERMVKQLDNRDKTFIFGVKRPHGLSRTQFVENFALCKRQDLIDAGMFNERITVYGGMTQELRVRLVRQGWQFKRCEDAFADQKMSSNHPKKKQDIMAAKNILYKLGM